MKRFILAGIAVLVLVGITGVVFAASNKPVEAGEKPPIVVAVENHEQRLGDLETKTDDIQTQVNQNTSDISSMKNDSKQTVVNVPVDRVVTVVEKAPPITPEDYPYTPNNPEPTPQPIDPRTIVSMTQTERYAPADKGGEFRGYDCHYVLQNGHDKGTINGPTAPCYAVGTILPSWIVVL